MLAIGLDVHLKTTMVSWVDTDTGELSKPFKVPTLGVVDHIAALEGPKCVALETGTHSIILARQLYSLDIEVLVVKANAVAPLMKPLRTAKTDRHDSQCLARLLASGQLDEHTVWVADEETAAKRVLTRGRKHHVHMRTQQINHLRSFIKSQGEQFPFTDLLGKKGQAWLAEFAERLAPTVRAVFDVLHTALHNLDANVRELEASIHQAVAEDEGAQHVDSLTGCGAVLALSVSAEMGTPRRFPNGNHSVSYSGLAPQIRQSGERCYTGPLPHQRNPHLQQALVLVAQHFARSGAHKDTRLMKMYWRVYHRHGPNPAKIALARRLCIIIYAMLRDGTDFDPSLLAT